MTFFKCELVIFFGLSVIFLFVVDDSEFGVDEGIIRVDFSGFL